MKLPLVRFLWLVGFSLVGLWYGSIQAEETTCKAEPVQIQFKKVCPPAEERESHLRLEIASHPLLTIEAKAEEESLAYPMYFQSAAPTLLINSFEMAAENLFVTDSQKNLIVHYPDLSKLPSTGTNKIQISFYLCDDTNGDGKCADEDKSNQIAHPTTFEACHLPSTVVLDVSSCEETGKPEENLIPLPTD